MPSILTRSVTVATVLLAVVVDGARGFEAAGPSAPPVARPPAQAGYPQPYAPQERMSVVDPDKKLTAGDQVTLEIVEDREPGLQRVITATGELDVPPLGRVRVAGKTATEAAVSIKQLLERDYYYTATVRLSIDQTAKYQVQQGSVQISGPVLMQGMQTLVVGEPLTLSSAVLRAAPTQWANLRKVQVARQKKDGTSEVFQVDVKRIIEKGDAKSDPVLQDGDRINIPKRDFVF